jgi:general secretion pathway protein G
MTDPVQVRTVNFLQKMFPRFNTSTPVDWNNNSTPGEKLELFGEECLTFFLGGIPSSPGSGPNTCLGFSSDDSNPGDTTSTKRRGPFMDFKSARLDREASNGFFKYRDPFSTSTSPAYYIFFSCNGTTNGYSLTDARQTTAAGVQVQPYYQTPPSISLPAGVFMNRDGFQIISAGRDGKFGPGGTGWTVSAGYGPGVDGSDDIANFSGAELRAGQN